MPEKPVRPSMSKMRRARIWDRDKGICYLCSKPVQLGELWDADHKLAWALTFDDSDENLAVAHKDGCHQEKTKSDVKRIAKAKRQSGVEGGQYAKRARNGPTMKSRPFPKGSRKIESRPFETRKK